MNAEYTTRDIIEMAVQAKDKSVEFYMALARNSENYHVSQLFAELAKSKQHHKLELKKWLDTIGEEKREEAYPGERSLFLKSLVDEKTFNCDNAQKKLLETTISEEEALGAGIGFEKDFMLFLHELKQHVSDEGTDIIDKLIDDEIKHIKEMFDVKDKLSRGE